MLVEDRSAGTRLGRWWRGRFGRRLALEVLLLFALLSLYRLGRYLGRDQVADAFRHAHQVVRWEGHLGMAHERSFQRAVLDHLWMVRFLNRYYAMVHFPATVAYLALVYTTAPELYRKVRLQFISVTAVALVMQIAYPLAPPRMLPGFVDTVARYGPAIYSRPGVESIANQYAAMPSLHVGWALMVAWGMWHLTSRPWRWIGVVHAAITAVAVVATANHYWADGAIALVLVLVATWIVSTRHRADPSPADPTTAPPTAPATP